MNPGELVAGRFEILRVAGAGGMGVVYLARDTVTATPVAVKVLTYARGESARRFAREASLLASLAHEAIVRYVAHGETAEGQAYLVMEWVEGESLAARLERGPLGTTETLVLGAAIADALSVAHERGVVHRDIKPDNLLLADGDVARVKVLDFGIARRRERQANVAATGTGIALGTPGYMAPEQARGQKDAGPAADVFSLGCVLFECVTGRAPFVAEHVMALLAKILLEDAPRLEDVRPGVSPALDDLVARMLAKDPRERPSDGAAVARELEAISLGAEARPSVRPPPRNALTKGEQELLCVVMAGQSEATSLGTAPTLAADDPRSRDGELRDVVEAYDGQLESLANGALVVTLRGSGAATDRVARAARCALILREKLPFAPMALATGRGRIAGRWPVGEVIDRAASLVRIAAHPSLEGAKGVRIDPVTAGLLDARFDTKRDERGDALLGERRDEGATRTLLGRATPCVGRDRELGQLDAMISECREESVASAALVTAAAGIGKSRLRHELLRRSVREGEQLWIGRGDSMSAGAPFGLIAQALGGAVGLAHGEPLATRRERIRERAARHLDAATARRVASFLGEVAGAPFDDVDHIELRAARRDPVLMGDQIHRAFSDFLRAECAQGLVFIVLEDLHWGDWPSLRLIDASLRSLSESPLMVLGFGRPETLDTFPRLWTERNVQHIRLGELTQKGSAKLVRQVLGDSAAPEVVQKIVERAAGNALYLEELIRAVAEGRGDEPPETVLAMVEARLGSMAAETRRLLRAGSVFGEVFWSGGVERLLGGDEAAGLDRRLSDLSEREVIAKLRESRFPHETEYAFRHALVRDGAYAMLTEEDRVVGHRLAATWLEEAGEQAAVVLAEHFERAEEPLRAAAFFRRAAEQALGGNDFDAAVAHAERGLRCGITGEERGLLALAAAEARGWRSDAEEQEAAALIAMEELPRGSATWCRAVRELLSAHGRAGKRESLVALTEELCAMPEPLVAERVITIADGVVHRLRLGDYAGCEPLMGWLDDHAGAFLEQDPGVEATVRLTDAWWAFCRGEPPDPAREEASAKAFEAIGDLRRACRGRLHLGYAYLELGAYEVAERELRSVVTTADRLGISAASASSRQILGMTVSYLGRFEEGLSLLQESVEMLRAAVDPRTRGGSLVYIARTRLMMGQPELAEQATRDALVLLDAAPPFKAQTLAMLAEALLVMGRDAEARACVEASMRLLDELGSIEEGESHVRLMCAEVLWAAGDHEGARATIRAAESRLRERAALIRDEALRKSFLERVPDNRKTLERARAMGA